MMRRFARHETIAAQRIAGTDTTVYAFAQPGDHVRTVDGPGIVADVYQGPVAGGESYYVILDDGLGEGEYAGEQVLDIIPDDFTITARRYSQVPMACDVCGAPAHKSRSGGVGGHTMLCPDCEAERDRQKSASAVSSARGSDAGDRRRGRQLHAGGDRRAPEDRRDGHVRADRGGDPGVRSARLTSVAANRYTITVSTKAKRDYMSLTPADRSRILDAVKEFQKTGKGDIKPIIGTKPLQYRLRVGKMRVIYLPQGGSHVEIIELGYRGQLGWSEAAAGYSLDAYALWTDQIKPKLGPGGARWADRVCDMLRFSLLAGHTRSGDPVNMGLRVTRVAKDWPISGSIFVEREDGAKIRLYLDGTTFRTEILNKGDLGKNASSGEGGTRTAARADLPLMSPEELREAGLRTAADDYEQLGEILWERPDLVEAQPAEGMPRRVTLGSKTAERAEPVWLKERRSNPIKDSLNDAKQPWWWRKMVGPALDRYNDSVPPDRQIQDYDDIHKIDSKSWCRFRRKGECYFPKEFDEQGSEEAGYAVWIPFNRGECPWKTWEAQKKDCKVSEPGPNSGERVTYPDATVSWSQGGQRVSSLTETPVTITRKTEAAWVDIREKAKRIRQSGGVRVIAVADNSVTGEVRGDTGLYTATVTTVPGTNQVALATCSCPWETYRWARSGPWKKLEGRACAHITALLYEMQARKMFGGEITEDVAAPEWRTEQPALENPKSRPGPWRLDVAASVQGHLAAIVAQRDALDARAAVEVHLDPQALSLGVAVANLADDESGEGALVSVAKLLEARSLIDVPPFYAQVSGEIVVVDGFDEDGIPWANGRPLSRRQLLYPTFHPTRGITGSLEDKLALYDDLVDLGKVNPDKYSGETTMRKGDWGYYSREQALLDNGFPKGQLFSSEEAMRRYIETVARQEGVTEPIEVTWVWWGGEAGTVWANDWSRARMGFGEGTRYEAVALHELAHLILRKKRKKAPSSHGAEFAAEHARLIEKYMGITLQTGFNPMDFAAAKKTAAHSGCMVALVPSPEVAASISLAAAEIDGVRAEPAEEIHLTLAYLGKAADIDRATFMAAVQGIAAVAGGGLTGTTSGWGTFDNAEEKVLWASMDVPGLDVLRMMVVEGLTAAGLPVATNHGFTPHMTAGYSDEPITGFPETTVSGQPLVFDAIVAAYAGEWTYFDLTSPTGEAVVGETKTGALDTEIPTGGYTHAGLIVKAVDTGRVLMTQRSPYHGDDEETKGTWEFPGGSIDEGETPLQAALREFGEETGLTLPEGYQIEGSTGSADGTYLSIVVLVPNEAWTVNADLLPMETMGIGWFHPDHVEETPITRPEVDDTDWDSVKEASLQVYHDGQWVEVTTEVLDQNNNAILSVERWPDGTKYVVEAFGVDDDDDFDKNIATPVSFNTEAEARQFFQKRAMFEPRPDGEVLARDGGIVYRRKSMLGDNGVEAWLADAKLVGQLIWERSGERVGEIQGVDVLRNYRRKGIATKMFELAKQVEPRVHHSTALTDDGKAWSKTVAGLHGRPDDISQDKGFVLRDTLSNRMVPRWFATWEEAVAAKEEMGGFAKIIRSDDYRMGWHEGSLALDDFDMLDVVNGYNEAANSGQWRQIDQGIWFQDHPQGWRAAYDRAAMSPKARAKYDEKFGSSPFAWERFVNIWVTDIKERQLSGKANSLDEAKAKAEKNPAGVDDQVAKYDERMRKLMQTSGSVEEFERDPYALWGEIRYVCPDHIGSGRVAPASEEHPCDTCGSTTPAWTKTAVSNSYRYHLTSKVDFKLDPKKRPENNTTLGGDWPPGIFLTKPEGIGHWAQGYGYWRPWVVEFDVGSAKPKFDEGFEAYYPAEEYPKMRVLRVLPLDAFCREQYGAWGWTEEDTGLTFDTMEPYEDKSQVGTATSWDDVYPWRNWHYSGDARNESSSWREAYVKRVRNYARSHRGVIASLDVEAEAEAILHDEPQPALPEALGAYDTMEPDRFGVSVPELNTTSPRSEPDEQFENEQHDDFIDSAGIQNFGGIDPRVAWLLNEGPQNGDDEIALAAQAALSKMALKTFSIEEQQELIHEGADDHRGARNTDRLSIAGTHYEYDSQPGGDLDLETLW